MGASIVASSLEAPSHPATMPCHHVSIAASSAAAVRLEIQANHPSSPNRTARPTASLAPFRVAAAASLSSSARKDAGAVQPHSSPYGLAKHERREVPLPSQEGTKGLVQYALYVPSHFSTHRHAGACLALFRFSPPLTTTAAPAQPSTS